MLRFQFRPSKSLPWVLTGVVVALAMGLLAGCGANEPLAQEKGDKGSKSNRETEKKKETEKKVEPLTAAERNRWEKIRKMFDKVSRDEPEKKFDVAIHSAGEWRAFSTSRTPNSFRAMGARANGAMTLEDAKKMAETKVETPSTPPIDMAAVIDYYSEENPKVVFITKHKQEDEESLNQFVVAFQKSVSQ